MKSDGAINKCPFCAEVINTEATKCRFCGSLLDRTIFLRTWTRSRSHGKLLGICAGLAKEFNIDVKYVRLFFIVAALFGGLGILLYLGLWLLMPYDQDPST